MSTLCVQNVTKEFSTRAEPLVVLRDANLQLESGESAAILGPSGSGKSTLLQIIGTLDTPTSGTITLDGKEPFTLSETELARFRNKKIGFVFQDHHLLPQCSVLENVLLPTIAEGSATPNQIERGGYLLERVGLTDRITHRPAELSGGERQRVAIARALINQPVLLLADEPTGNLDRATAEEISGLLLEMLPAEQTMLLVVTHSLDLAKRLERRWELDDGRLKDVE